MIQLYQTNRLLEQPFVRRLSEPSPKEVEAIGQLSGAVFITKDHQEYAKLIEVALQELVEKHTLYVVLIESSPQYKSRMRSHRGLLGQLKKTFGEENYVEREIDLSENQSLFVGVLRVEQADLSYFLAHLTDTVFGFGLLVEQERVLPADPRQLVELIYSEMVRINKLAYLDVLQGLVHFCQPGILLFTLNTDGQGRLRLAFFGYHPELETKIPPLIVRLSANFYLRRRQKWFDVPVGEEE